MGAPPERPAIASLTVLMLTFSGIPLPKPKPPLRDKAHKPRAVPAIPRPNPAEYSRITTCSDYILPTSDVRSPVSNSVQIGTLLSRSGDSRYTAQPFSCMARDLPRGHPPLALKLLYYLYPMKVYPKALCGYFNKAAFIVVIFIPKYMDVSLTDLNSFFVPSGQITSSLL